MFVPESSDLMEKEGPPQEIKCTYTPDFKFRKNVKWQIKPNRTPLWFTYMSCTYYSFYILLLYKLHPSCPCPCGLKPSKRVARLQSLSPHRSGLPGSPGCKAGVRRKRKVWGEKTCGIYEDLKVSKMFMLLSFHYRFSHVNCFAWWPGRPSFCVPLCSWDSPLPTLPSSVWGKSPEDGIQGSGSRQQYLWLLPGPLRSNKRRSSDPVDTFWEKSLVLKNVLSKNPIQTFKRRTSSWTTTTLLCCSTLVWTPSPSVSKNSLCLQVYLLIKWEKKNTVFLKRPRVETQKALSIPWFWRLQKHPRSSGGTSYSLPWHG